MAKWGNGWLDFSKQLTSTALDQVDKLTKAIGIDEIYNTGGLRKVQAFTHQAAHEVLQTVSDCGSLDPGKCASSVMESTKNMAESTFNYAKDTFEETLNNPVAVPVKAVEVVSKTVEKVVDKADDKIDDWKEDDTVKKIPLLSETLSAAQLGLRGLGWGAKTTGTVAKDVGNFFSSAGSSVSSGASSAVSKVRSWFHGRRRRELREKGELRRARKRRNVVVETAKKLMCRATPNLHACLKWENCNIVEHLMNANDLARKCTVGMLIPDKTCIDQNAPTKPDTETCN